MKKLLAIPFVIAGLSAHAQDSGTTSALEFSREEAQVEPRGVVVPFIGFGGGYTGYDTNGAVEGTPASIKLLGSYYLQSPVVFDLGYGANNQQFTQSSGSQETAVTGGVLEIAARYRFENRWQLGVVGNHLFEQGKYFTADQGDAQFVGLQVLREMNISPSWLARLGARAMTLTNDTGDLTNMYMIDLQIGWNPVAYKTSVRSTASTTDLDEEMPSDQQASATEDSQQRVEPARPVAMEAAPESALKDINYSLISGASAIQFKPAQYAVAPADQQKLARVAEALNENTDLYERVEIHGFADSSGDEDMNQRLSQQRADQVKSIMEKSGLNTSNVIAVGRGDSDSSGISSKDRRAELVFIGVKDEAALREALSEVQ